MITRTLVNILKRRTTLEVGQTDGFEPDTLKRRIRVVPQSPQSVLVHADSLSGQTLTFLSDGSQEFIENCQCSIIVQWDRGEDKA